MSEEEMIDKLRFCMRDSKSIIDIINKPGVTPKVLMEAMAYSKNEYVLLAILDSPALTKEVFEEVFESSIRTSGMTSVDSKIMEHPFFTQEMYDRYVGLSGLSSYSGALSRLVSSKFASESGYLTMVRGFVSWEKSSDKYLTILSGKACTAKVILAIIYNEPKSDVIDACLEHPAVNEEVLSKIVGYCIKDYSNLHYCMNKAIAHKLMTKDLLLKFIDEYGDTFISRYKSQIIDSPLCDEDVLMKMANPSYIKDLLVSPKVTPAVIRKTLHNMGSRYFSSSDLLAIVKSIINSSAVDEALLIELVHFISNNFGSSYSSYDYSRSDNASGLYKSIITNPACTEKVLVEVLSCTSSRSVLDEVVKSPLAGKDVKIGIIMKNSSLSEEDIEAFFAIPGLTVDDVIKMIKAKPSCYEVIDKALDLPFANSELYKTVVSVIYGDRKVQKGNRDLLKKILDKDVPEIILVEIVRKTVSIDVVKMVIANKNANLNVVAALLVAADRFTEAEKKEILGMASKLKSDIISKIYKIEEEENVTEILRRNIEDGMSTMLWGPSGVGKSSRVFEIDPTATLLILKNGMLPEEVIGGKEPNGEPGKIYPPHWYVVLCQKCKAEPDRKHVLFIDEFTNVNDTIKNLVWEVVGNRLVNGHEEWPLPENCSIVVAGNRPEESSAVRIDMAGGVMPAPLHNRIDSMIEIQFDIDEWQKWALETDSNTGNLRIHPIVYSFCVAHADKVMFTAFNPEDITSPFLSPRKWEALSRAIYAAEARGGEYTHISNGRILSILGNNDIARAFIAHYERLPIDMKKIENGEYTEDDFPSVEDKLYALGIVIAKYQGDDVAIEDFIVECLGDEYLSIYNNMKKVRNSVLQASKPEGKKL